MVAALWQGEGLVLAAIFTGLQPDREIAGKRFLRENLEKLSLIHYSGRTILNTVPFPRSVCTEMEPFAAFTRS